MDPKHSQGPCNQNIPSAAALSFRSPRSPCTAATAGCIFNLALFQFASFPPHRLQTNSVRLDDPQQLGKSLGPREAKEDTIPDKPRSTRVHNCQAVIEIPPRHVVRCLAFHVFAWNECHCGRQTPKLLVGETIFGRLTAKNNFPVAILSDFALSFSQLLWHHHPLGPFPQPMSGPEPLVRGSN